MKSFRCAKCEKAIRSLKSGMIQWKHNPATGFAGECQIIHLDCGYDERAVMCANCFTEEILLVDVDLDKLKKNWKKGSYQVASFKNVMNILSEKL